MVQRKTIIQSGQQTLRAYENDGILTPASGLSEYVRYRGTAEKPFSTQGTVAKVKLFKLPFAIKLERLTFGLSGTVNNAANISIGIENEVGYVTIPSNTNYWHSLEFNGIVNADIPIIFIADDAIGTNVNIDIVDIIGYRVAFEVIAEGFNIG